ncbi:MAG: hypothetical protein VX370_04480 [Bacteroidota bacterium]|nr:hypothetical protein [Bacteroidota bacterium]
MKNILFSFFIMLLILSCSNQEEGTSSIQGKVYMFQSLNLTDTLFYHPYADKDVYIIYSSNENDVYDDSFETHWDGTYRFDNLQQGNYIIFTYVDSTMPLQIGSITIEYPILKHIEIKENNTVYTLEDIVVEHDE